MGISIIARLLVYYTTILSKWRFISLFFLSQIATFGGSRLGSSYLGTAFDLGLGLSCRKKLLNITPKNQLLISLFFIFYTVLSYKYLHLYRCSLVFVIVIYTICPSLIVDRLIKMYITSMTLSYNVPNKSGRSHSCIHNSIYYCVEVEFKANER